MYDALTLQLRATCNQPDQAHACAQLSRHEGIRDILSDYYAHKYKNNEKHKNIDDILPHSRNTENSKWMVCILSLYIGNTGWSPRHG